MAGPNNIRYHNQIYVQLTAQNALVQHKTLQVISKQKCITFVSISPVTDQDPSVFG